MPVLTDPPTRSPGWLVLYYQGYQPNIVHTTRVRYIVAALPITQAAAQADADDLAEMIAPVMREQAYTALSWRVVNELNLTVWEGTFAAPIVGTHADPLLDTPYLSQTISFTGRGVPDDYTWGAGQARMTLYTVGTYTFGIGDKRILLSDASATALAAMAAALGAHPHFWADFWGQPATVRNYVNIQFNAAVQRAYGT